MQKANSDGTHTTGHQLAYHLFDLFIARGLDDAARSIHPLMHLGTQGTRDHRIGAGCGEVVQVVAQLARNLDHIAKAGGGDEAGAGALALDHQVGDRRGGTGHHLAQLRQRDAVLLQHALQTGADGTDHIIMVAQHLGGMNAPVTAQQHQIGEGATDVKSKAIAQRVQSFTLASLMPRSKPFSNLPYSNTSEGIWK